LANMYYITLYQDCNQTHAYLAITILIPTVLSLTLGFCLIKAVRTGPILRILQQAWEILVLWEAL